MKKMLIISRYTGHDASPYAGIKIHYHYLNKFIADGNFSIKLISFCNPGENANVDLHAKGIDADVSCADVSHNRTFFLLMHNWQNVPNYFGKTMGLENGYIRSITLKKLKALKKQGYSPEIILLEWTQILLMIRDIKKIFPLPFYCAIEHDVAFEKYGRTFHAAKGVQKIKEYLRLKCIKKTERSCLQAADMIMVLDPKDRNVVVSSGINPEKVHVLAPYYTNYQGARYNPNNSNILFFGAMDRVENYKSIIWFIENVFNYLPSPYTLTIAGNKPHRSLEKFKSERIEITGFVPDILPYLQNSFCMVAPLLLGAGIKIKILEAMSAGLPVLTNSIGIEGIPAQNGVHYLHCEKPEEYLNVFKLIQQNRINLHTISGNAKKMVAQYYDLEQSFISYKEAILKGYANKKDALPHRV
jgi:Glycosyltransferase